MNIDLSKNSAERNCSFNIYGGRTHLWHFLYIEIDSFIVLQCSFLILVTVLCYLSMCYINKIVSMVNITVFLGNCSLHCGILCRFLYFVIYYDINSDWRFSYCWIIITHLIVYGFSVFPITTKRTRRVWPVSHSSMAPVPTVML